MLIYTSYPDFVDNTKKVTSDDDVYHYHNLPEKKVEWITDIILQPMTSPAEKLFLDKVKGFKYSMLSQVYFNIDGKEYFLDFFVPKLSIAFEIDGCYNHISPNRELKDIIRDDDFWSIGIKTIRFTYNEIKSDGFRDKTFVPRLKEFISQGNDYNPWIYYDIPKTVRFYGEQTPNQKMLLSICEILESDKSRNLIIVSSSFYIVQAGSDNIFVNEDTANLDLLKRLNKAINNRNVCFYFSGKRDNIFRNPNRSYVVKSTDRKYNKCPSDTPLYEIEYNNKRVGIKKLSKCGFELLRKNGK